MLARLAVVAVPAAQGARGPIVSAKLVENRSVDPGPGELLERRALGGVVAVNRADQRFQPARNEVVDLAAGRNLPDLLVHDVLHHRGKGQDQAVAYPWIAALLVGVPQEKR